MKKSQTRKHAGTGGEKTKAVGREEGPGNDPREESRKEAKWRPEKKSNLGSMETNHAGKGGKVQGPQKHELKKRERKSLGGNLTKAGGALAWAAGIQLAFNSKNG